MILADTSVWVDHLRGTTDELTSALEAGEVSIHPFVIGELACGNLENRDTLIDLLRSLPESPVAHEEEALAFIERHGLMGHGIGYIDVHLLASAALGAINIWTRDRRLIHVASELGLARTG